MYCLHVGQCTVLCNQRSEESTGFPCNWCWGLNPGLLQEQSALLTAKPSLQPRQNILWV